MEIKATAEQKLLLQVLFKTLNNEIYTDAFPAGIDWDRLVKESREHAIGALTYYSIDREAIPAEASEKWNTLALQEIAHQIWVAQAHADIVKLFTENGIGVVTMKGCASAAYYPHSEYRSLGDVDFFVVPEEHEKGNALLLANGYKAGNRIGHHDKDYYKHGIHFEMHFAISGVPRGVDGEPFRKELVGLIRDSRSIQTVAGSVIVPSDYHHGLIILLHTGSHLLSEGIGLRHLCDWAAFVNHFSDDEFCVLFKERFERLGIWRFAQVLTKTCERYLGIRPCAWSGAVDESVTGKLLEDILASGDGGREQGKADSGLLVSDGFSIRVSSDSGLRQFFSTMSGVVETHWPMARKFKILLPFGWLFFGLRYMIRMLLGKRKKMNLIEMAKSADKRKNLYKEFGLSERTESEA